MGYIFMWEIIANLNKSNQYFHENGGVIFTNSLQGKKKNLFQQPVLLGNNLEEY